jgi:hypothetical protein
MKFCWCTYRMAAQYRMRRCVVESKLVKCVEARQVRRSSSSASGLVTCVGTFVDLIVKRGRCRLSLLDALGVTE